MYVGCGSKDPHEDASPGAVQISYSFANRTHVIVCRHSLSMQATKQLSSFDCVRSVLSHLSMYVHR